MLKVMSAKKLEQAVLVAAIEQLLELSSEQENLGNDITVYTDQLQGLTLKLVKLMEEDNGL